MRVTAADEPTTERCLDRLPLFYRALRANPSVGELLTDAALLGCRECGFARGLVVGVEDGHLSAAGSDALADPASDALRRKVLARPIPLLRGTEEGDQVRSPFGGHHGELPSELARALELEQYVIAPIAPEGPVLALLVLDRPEPAVTAVGNLIVRAFAAILAMAYEHVVLKSRVATLSAEIRHCNASTEALVREVLHAPVSLLPASGFGPTQARFDVPMRAIPAELAELFSEAEMRIVALLVEGLSNRQIAAELIVSPETVKSHVRRILRKLDASSRVEAVTRVLRWAEEARS